MKIIEKNEKKIDTSLAEEVRSRSGENVFLCYQCKKCASARTKRWRENNRGRVAARGREYRAANRKRISAQRREHYFVNRDRLTAQKREHYRKLRLAAIRAYGGSVCTNCGEDRLEVLTLDHVGNDGSKHRRAVGIGPKFYRWLQRNNYPPGLQVLCFNCNSGKTVDGEKSMSQRQGYGRKLKMAAFEAYGGATCAVCGEDRLEVLSIDHVGGGGNKHRKTIGVGSGRTFYRWLRDNGYPPGFQVLCFNCNILKYRETGK